MVESVSWRLAEFNKTITENFKRLRSTTFHVFATIPVLATCFFSPRETCSLDVVTIDLTDTMGKLLQKLEAREEPCKTVKSALCTASSSTYSFCFKHNRNHSCIHYLYTVLPLG